MGRFKWGYLDEETAAKTFAEAKAINEARLREIKKAKKAKK